VSRYEVRIICFRSANLREFGNANMRGSLAYAELYLTISMVVRRFHWDMYETGLNDIVCKHDFFVAVGDLQSKGVRATFQIRS